ncbi:2-dehydro-3-deoxygalactonokinase [Croceicoccus hydrothermalis]|uniref:2-dehydro-3-deoxygalactonokinase n=1 Tax=Croceicoccus hydrothermalis TaxID=2867964 RepID=UPI001EFAC14D|nr:2-dehydro-3-deoxygalactonokinase [Croceicoccus hydrothermalis]
MQDDDCYIAIDWGTTNRRIYLIDQGGHVLRTRQDDKGVLSMGAEWDDEILAIRAEFGDLPILAGGMVGSTKGWCDVPYVGVPAGLDTLAYGVVSPISGVVLIPGIAVDGRDRVDVMRGEEIQLLGAIGAGYAPFDAYFCQPGTHCKWVHAQEGRIVDFTTAMTGELFALLQAEGILSDTLRAPVTAGEAFRDGVRRGLGACDLAAALFEVRSRQLFGRLEQEDAASFASGILIGADVGSRTLAAGQDIHVIAEGALAKLYGMAIKVTGARAKAVDGDAAFVAGIREMRKRLA